MRIPVALRPLVVSVALVAASCSSGGSDSVVATTSAGSESTAATTDPAESSADADQTAPVEIQGEKLGGMPQGAAISDDPATDASIGTVVPSLSGTSFDGSPVTITADGRNKAVMFIAHWCPHCQAEVQLVTELVSNGQLPEDLDLYAVTIAVSPDRDNYPPSDWLAREAFPVPVIRDTAQNAAADAFAVGGIPYVVYVDGENKLLARSSGSLDADDILKLWLETAAA